MPAGSSRVFLVRANAIVFVGACLAMISTPRANADPADCQPADFSYNNTTGLTYVWVNAASDYDSDSTPAWREFGFASEAEAVQAVVLGLSLLNEQSHARHFRFAGLTNELDIPPDATGANGCDNSISDPNDWTVDYSIIVFRDVCSNGVAVAQAEPRCGGDQFRIRLWDRSAPSGTCVANNWANGALSQNRDVAAIVAHEGLHTSGIGHPMNGEGATVRPGTLGSIARNLFQYDFECSHAERRSVLAYKRSSTSSGFGSATVVSSTETVTKAAAGMTYVSGSAIFSAGLHRGTIAAFDQGADGSSTSFSSTVSFYNGVGFVPGLVRETPSVDRVFYSSWLDNPSQTNWSSVHRVRQVRSTGKFANRTAEDLLQCATSSGWYGCATTTPVLSGGRISVAYLDDIDQSIFAWAHHDRDNWGTDSEAEEVRLTVGMVNDSTLPIAFETGYRTAVPPAITCREDEIGGSDCILLYVPIEDRLNPLTAIRFSVTGANLHSYTLGFDGSPTAIGGNAATGNPVAVWYLQDVDEVLVAYRSSNANQKIQVRKRSNGGTWSSVATDLDDSITGPSAISMWRGTNNMLLYTK